MHKLKPTYDLATIKDEFAKRGPRMSATADRDRVALNLDVAAVGAIVQSITRAQFYKSMTTKADSRVWQDVYHVPSAVGVLYVKFMYDAQGHLLISFKLRDEEE
jgi:motility quorum-sensing regulator/GCU-specific mRNA interferase toxin